MPRRKPVRDAPFHTFEPWLAPKATKADIFALKALQAGVASDIQQKRALKFIVERCAGTYEEQFVPGDDRSTTYALGKRRVGTMIISFMNSDPERFPDES